MSRRLDLALLGGMLLGAAMGHAQVKLPAVFGDHMVLQTGTPVPVWGMGTPGAKVSVAFAGQTATTQVDGQGYWALSLKPLKPSDAGAEFTVTEGAEAPVVLHDVVVGEVWLAGGQSNMAYALNTMEGKEPILAAAENPKIRLFLVNHRPAAEPEGMHPGDLPGDVDGKWELSTVKSAKRFSAVAYMFGAELERRQHTPVGLISSNWGGTPIQAWMSLDALSASPALATYAAQYQEALAKHRDLVKDPKNDANYQAAWKSWSSRVGESYNAALKRWNAEVAAGRSAGPKPELHEPEPKNPDPMGMPDPDSRPGTPAVLWNAMCEPLVSFAVRGALWYQGEANVGHYVDYGLQLRTMVADWRKKWGEPAMEFLVVQLPALDSKGKPNLAFLREQQATVLQLPHTGLAVTYDVGDPGDVHPKNKVDVAHRLALLARARVYGEKIQATGPMMQTVTMKGDVAEVTFRETGAGLVIGQSPWLAKDAVQYPKDRLIGFELAGADGVYHDAQAKIAGDKVLVTASEVKAPVTIRYAFAASPRANLYNADGLPAAPFRTDQEP